MTQIQEVQRCPQCNHIVSKREITLNQVTAGALWKVYQWCKQNKRHEFQRKQIRHLLHTDTEIATFGDLIHFGGLTYKMKRGYWGLNMERCEQFFRNKLKIRIRILKNPVTQDTETVEEGTLKDIPKLYELLNEDMEFVTVYHENTLFPVDK